MTKQLSGVSEEEPLDMPEEEEPPPTSLWSHPMKSPPGAREEEWSGDGYSFPPPTYAREERCGSREKRTSRIGLGPASSRAPNTC
jgi:hypothetical protein